MTTVGGRFGGNAQGSLQGTVAAPRALTKLDGGHGRPQREIVQDACVHMLGRLLYERGGYLEAIEATDAIVRGPDDEYGIAEVLDQLGSRAPAILIATGDADFETAGDIDRWKKPTRVHVYFFVNSLRSKINRTIPDVVALGDRQKDPGAFVMMEHAAMLLIGQAPGNTTKSIKNLRPVSERRLAADSDLVIWEQVYSVALGLSVDLNRDIDLELRQINAYHRLAEQESTDETIVETETTVGESE